MDQAVELLDRVGAIVDRHAPAIRERFTDGLVKRWPGYAFDRWLREPGNLLNLLVGSEGTLAAITSAELSLVPIPKSKGLVLLYFPSVIDERAFNRITRALDEAQERGATLVQLVPGPKWDAATRKIAPHIGYRTYNFNLAESITPYSKISIYKQEIPFLKAHNCSALNFETFGSWAIEGPHTYLSARLAWDAGANVDAIMAEFYDRLFGKAAPHVRYYWERVDRAFVEAATHAGSFYCLPRIWTPEMLRACTKDLEAAEKAAQSDIIRQRVRVFRRGLENARMYMDIHNASLEGDWVRAKDVYDRFLAHAREMVSDGILNPYGVTYLERFVAPGVLAGYARCTDGCSIVARLPDEWQFRYDAEDRGESEKWFSPDAPSDGWRTVRTYTSTIEEPGIEEQMTFMWYSTRVNVDKAGAGLVLWFSDVDGRSKVWVNGKPAGEGAPGNFDIDLKGLLKPGPNSITVRVDHSRISDLALGGILGPAFIYSRSQPQQQP